LTLVSQLITDSYREHNLIAIGDSPTAAESTEALRLLNRFVLSLFERVSLTSINYGTTNVRNTEYDQTSEVNSLFVPDNSRLICNLAAAATVYLPPKPQDGSRFGVIDVASNFNTNTLTLNGNGRDVEAASSLVLSTASLGREWFYRNDLGNWVRLADLLTTDQSPFPTVYDDLLIIGLAIRVNPRHGRPVSPESLSVYNKLLNKFKGQYFQSKEVGVENGLLSMTNGQYNYNSNTAFNVGWPN